MTLPQKGSRLPSTPSLRAKGSNPVATTLALDCFGAMHLAMTVLEILLHPSLMTIQRFPPSPMML